MIRHLYGDIAEDDELVDKEFFIDGVIVEVDSESYFPVSDNTADPYENDEPDIILRLNKSSYCAGDTCHEQNNFRFIEAGDLFSFGLLRDEDNWKITFCQYTEGETMSQPILVGKA